MKKLIIILLLGFSVTAGAQNFCNFSINKKMLVYQNITYKTLKIMYNGTAIASYAAEELITITTTLTNSTYILELNAVVDQSKGRSMEIPVDHILYISTDPSSYTITLVLH